uniref:Uncharacterized protein n=1 Tax=Fagus sylvatica TaxID=28930 RepID=A0A2N9GKH7_FAGSY
MHHVSSDPTIPGRPRAINRRYKRPFSLLSSGMNSTFQYRNSLSRFFWESILTKASEPLWPAPNRCQFRPVCYSFAGLPFLGSKEGRLLIFQQHQFLAGCATVDMKMQNSGHFHGDANSRHQQLAPSVGIRLSPLTNCTACQTSFLAFKDGKKEHHYGVERRPIYRSPAKSSSSELSRSSTRRRKEDLPFHAPLEVTAFLSISQKKTFLSTSHFPESQRPSPNQPNQAMGSTIGQKRCPILPSLVGILLRPSLSRASTRRRSDDLPFHVSSCARHVPVCADTRQAHANMLQAHAMCHVSCPHDATSASLLALIAMSSV